MRRAGDRARAVCPWCGQDTTISFEEHPIEYHHPTLGTVLVPYYLVGTCTSCGEVAVIPSEGTAALIRAIRRAQK
jgi:rRNA maturation protein Nop10